jgi:hypothetical protein
MKKRNKNKKWILQRLALKSFRRKMRSKSKKKQRNRQLLGVDKPQRKAKNIKKNIQQQQLAGYKQLKAPKTFSLTKNTEDTLSFIAQMEDCFEKKKKVFVNLEKVETIGQGAIVVMLSILVKFKANKIDFNGNFPKNKKAETNLKKSGFFKYLYDENITEQDVYSFENDICTHANKKVDSKLSDEIIKRASKFIWQEERRCTGLQRVFIELMQNTNNHASLTGTGEHHWWATVYYSKDDNKVCFAFIDYGVGILDSLNNKKEGKFLGVIPKIKQLFNPNSNADLLKLLLTGEVHKTATGNYYRGKGLPGIYEACKNNKISNLVIISNDAIADYANDKYESLNNKLSGTFVYWELNSKNDNIK